MRSGSRPSMTSYSCSGRMLASAGPRRRWRRLPSWEPRIGSRVPTSRTAATASTSLFGTYVRKNELLVYLFYEYTRNRDPEYKPSELGFGSDREFRAKKEEHEFLIFASYGFTDSLMVELESAVYTHASQSRASDDTSGMPRTFTESGVGDTEGQIRYRWFEETEVSPELRSYFGRDFPRQRHQGLLGT